MKKLMIGLAVMLGSLLLAVGMAVPAQAADELGGYCGYRAANADLDATCALTARTHTTTSTVTIQWHGLSGGNMKLVLSGPNGYTCTLGWSYAASNSRTCASVPGGDFTIRAYKQNNATVYIGSAW